MTILLNNIHDALEETMINKDQALYLIYTYNEISYPIEPVDLLALTKLRFITSGKIGKKLLTEENLNLNLKGTIKPIYKTEISAGIAKKICKLLCVKDKETGKIRLPGTEDTIEHTAKNYLGGEGLIAYHYIIFLFMFPVQGEYNRRWERHFTGFEYKGARLRVRSKGTATRFKKIVKGKDMGIFLYGTYLFIQSCIRENKTFVKTITNYTKEYQEWYDEAAEIINSAKSVDELFRVKIAKEGRLNVAL